MISLSAKRILERLEIELYHHGGKPEENGRLACTFDHFVEFGIERHAIAPAIRETVALGFVAITRQGCAGNAGYRQPTLYRLTYRHCGSHRETTDEWRRIKTVEDAETIARSARLRQPERVPKNKSPVRETPTTVPVRETPTTSISGGDTPSSTHDLTPTAADAPTLAWTKPVVRELFVPEAIVRRLEAEQWK